jgi:hypothetical protein
LLVSAREGTRTLDFIVRFTSLIWSENAAIDFKVFLFV